jgi:hypothetical protein
MRTFLVTCFLALLATVLYAQDPGLPGGDPDTPVPIDGGLLVLLAAGIGYGASKIVKKEKTP